MANWTQEELADACARIKQPNPIAVIPVKHLTVDPGDFKEPENAYVGKERDLHSLFIADMTRRGAHCFYSRTDTAASIEPGLPDVHVLFTGEDGICRGCAVEFKVAGGTVKKHQREKISEMRVKRIPVLVTWTLADAINFARLNLKC